jgi:uncharacterized protein DUF4404
MGMDALKDKLKELHVSLEDAESPDAELTQLLQVLDSDIRALLVKQTPDKSASIGLASRAQTISAKFAAKHPHLEPALRELTDMLASLGI